MQNTPTPFASGFADDVQVYLDRYPHLTQAHRLRADAARIDHDSFELGLESLVRGLETLAREAGLPARDPDHSLDVRPLPT